MLARLQQLITTGIATLAVLWAIASWRAGCVGCALLGVTLVVFGYAAVLACEFAFLRFAYGEDPTPRPSVMQLLSAWGGEVVSAPTVFCWRQPFRSWLTPDQLPANAQGRRGVLLVHGFVCNRGLWNPWLTKLTGHQVPFIALNLEPVFGSISEYAPRIEDAVQRLHHSTGLPPVVVAHSMGGLAVRRWWVDYVGSHAAHRVITIATPHQGTWLARFGFSRNSREMRQGSRWLQDLAIAEPPERYAHFTCFYGHCDNIVFPPRCATLPGADNRHLGAVAHVHMASRSEPWQELQRQLGLVPTR